MNIHDATEYAYKNGYKDGVRDVLEEIGLMLDFTEVANSPLRQYHYSKKDFEVLISDLKKKYTEEKQ